MGCGHLFEAAAKTEPLFEPRPPVLLARGAALTRQDVLRGDARKEGEES